MSKELPVYDFTRPTDAKVFKWSPLALKKTVDIEGTYRHDSNRHHKPYAMLAAKLKGDDGAELPYGLFQEWQEVDVFAFMNESATVEQVRMASLVKQGDGNVIELERAYVLAKEAMMVVLNALDAAVAAAKVASPL